MTVAWAIVRALLVVLVVVAALFTVMWVLQRRLIYFPNRDPVPSAGRVLDGAEDVRLTTSDGLTLGAWFVPASDNPRNVVVLVANGNAGNRADRAPLAVALSRAGFDVLLFDYRGYGGNPGSPSEKGLARDVRAARQHLIDARVGTTKRVLYFGESLGAAVVAELAIDHPPAGMLLRSPFVDLASVATHHYPFLPVRQLLWDRFPLEDNASQLQLPVTVVYGTADSIVPPDHSQRVAAAANAVVVRVRGAGHNDAVMFIGQAIVDAVIELTERTASR